MITERDKEIIDFITQIGFSSIKHISDMFFTNTRYGYDLARKRLKKIDAMKGYIRFFRNPESNEIIYVPCQSKIRGVSPHNLKVLEYICKMKRLGCDMKVTEIEPVFNNVKPDAYITFAFDGYLYHQLLEVEMRHDYVDLKRFKDNDTINCILDRTKNVVPRIVIVQDTKRNYQKENDTKFKITQMGIGMEDIAKVLV